MADVLRALSSFSVSEQRAIRITGKGSHAYSIEIDGVDVAKYAKSLHLDMNARDVPLLEIDFLVFDSYVEVSGAVTYIAAGWGHQGSGKTPVGALRDLIAALEDGGPTNG